MNKTAIIGIAAIAVIAAGCVDREAQGQAARTKKLIEDPEVGS